MLYIYIYIVLHIYIYIYISYLHISIVRILKSSEASRIFICIPELGDTSGTCSMIFMFPPGHIELEVNYINYFTNQTYQLKSGYKIHKMGMISRFPLIIQKTWISPWFTQDFTIRRKATPWGAAAPRRSRSGPECPQCWPWPWIRWISGAWKLGMTKMETIGKP